MNDDNDGKEKVKSFPSLVAHTAALIMVSLTLSQTLAYTARPSIQAASVYLNLYTPQLVLVLTATKHGGIAGLS